MTVFIFLQISITSLLNSDINFLLDQLERIILSFIEKKKNNF